MTTSGLPGTRPVFTSGAARERFFAAYAQVLARWPAGTGHTDLASPFGTTHVHTAGPVDAPAVVLLHGGGATSAVWHADVVALAAHHRVLAPDLPGGATASVADGRRLRTPADLVAWVVSVLDGTGVDRAALVGHSYGAWIALRTALSAPDRVERLALVDPTDCFTGLSAAYRARALPVLVRPTADRMERLLRWETAGCATDPAETRLLALAHEDVRVARTVLPRRPSPDELRRLRVPVLVAVAGRSRAHDPAALAAAAAHALPSARVTTLAGVSHHTLPSAGAAQLGPALLDLLG